MSLINMPTASSAKTHAEYFNSKEGRLEAQKVFNEILSAILDGKFHVVIDAPSISLHYLLQSFGYKLKMIEDCFGPQRYSISWEENEENPDES